MSYGFPITNFCNPGVHYETPCMSVVVVVVVVVVLVTAAASVTVVIQFNAVLIY